jgi:uncharacterized protein YlbG (UPF0298 family)
MSVNQNTAINYVVRYNTEMEGIKQQLQEPEEFSKVKTMDMISFPQLKSMFSAVMLSDNAIHIAQ